jgi:hypothetical protein
VRTLQSRPANPLRTLAYKHVAIRRLLTVAILCLGVVLYRAGGASTGAVQVGHNEGNAPAPTATPTVYQDAVRLCQANSLTSSEPHWCGELAYAPGFNAPPSVATAASNGMEEFADPSLGAGLGYDANGEAPLDWRWNYQVGLWGAHSKPHWWQSALDLRTAIWYAEVTHTWGPQLQTILQRTYQRESGHTSYMTPFALANDNFTDDFMDDTSWWGLAWLAAAKYELDYQHDVADATTYLGLAQHDATYVATHGRVCGGIEWQIGTPPDTITSAEFSALTAGLATMHNTPGPFYNPRLAATWLAQAKTTMSWLEHRGLINVRTGKVEDRLNAACDRVIPGPMTYTEGEVADAYVQLGNATRDPAYYQMAAPFLRYVPSKQAGMVSHGVLEEPCERDRDGCTGSDRYLDLLVYKGILMQAYADYTNATGDDEFVYFIKRQASAVVHNAIKQPNGQPGNCNTAPNCQFVFYWGWALSPLRSPLVNQGTQMSALDALIADLALPSSIRMQ